MGNPETIEDKAARAGQLLLTGALDDADSLLREILADSPEHSHALHLAGLVEHRRGRNAEAVALLKRALELDPRDVAAHNSCGEAYRALGQLKSAEACFRQALQLSPSLSEAHLNLGLTLWAAGQRAEAATCFRNAIVLRPDSPKAHFYLGRLELEDENPRQAEQYLRRTLELRADYGEASFYLGRALAIQGRIPEAAAAFERALTDQPTLAAAHFEAARAAFELNDQERASEGLKKAMALDPSLVGLPGGLVASGRITSIEKWCDQRRADYVRVARSQWHKVAPPKVLPVEAGNGGLESLRPFTGDVFVAQVNRARVLPGELLVIGPDDTLFVDGVVSRPLQRPYTSRFIVYASDDGRVLMALPRRSVGIESPCVLLGAATSHFGWIYECLARLWILRQRPELEALPLVIQSGLSAWQREMLGQLGYSGERLIEAPEDAVLSCRQLYVASLVSLGHFIAPIAVEHLRREFGTRIAPQTDAPRRLYFSRNRLASRRLANEGELAPLLERHGFVVIHAEELGVSEQLGLLKSAEVVIGIEGAAMAHLFFAPPRARVGLILARGTESPRYYGPSAPLGHEFTFLLAQPDYASNAALQECDVVLAPDTLEAFLSEL